MKTLLHSVVDFKTNFIYQEALGVNVEAERNFRPEDVFMIGDSLTVGMASEIPGIRSNAEVGRSVRDMPAAVEAALAADPQPRVITILGGTNDGGDINQIRPAYNQMIAAARAAGVRVVLATLPPLRGQSLDETNAFIRGLAGPDVSIVELENYPLAGDSVHFSGYGAPAREIFNAARTVATGHESNTVMDILAGRIDPSVEISDAVIEAAASRIAASIPPALNLETILDEALNEVGAIAGASDVDAVADEVEVLVAEEAELDELAELSSDEIVQMQGISNREFLEMPMLERLRFITTDNVTAPEVAAGRVERLTYTFTFDGQYNNELWRDTTAGQTLPPEVRTVSSGGNVYHRAENALQGEFFTETGQRLKIHEGTALSDIQTGDLAEIQARVDERLAVFEAVEEGEEARTEGEMIVARMALERDVPPEFVMAAFVEQDNEIETEDLGISEESVLTASYRASLEHFLTDVHRAAGDFNGRYNGEETFTEDGLNPNFAAFSLAEEHETETITEIMLASGYTQEEVDAAADYITARQTQYEGGLNPENARILESGEIDVEPRLHAELNRVMSEAMANRHRYQEVADTLGIAWELIAAIHYRESSMNFNGHMHNGDPLGQYTTNHPAGVRFFDWESSAIDALGDSYYGRPGRNDIEAQANFAERYNGMGYSNNGVMSPYVWAGTEAYASGPGGFYNRDGNFQRGRHDQRLGVMPIVMALRARQGLDDEQ